MNDFSFVHSVSVNKTSVSMVISEKLIIEIFVTAKSESWLKFCGYPLLHDKHWLDTYL